MDLRFYQILKVEWPKKEYNILYKEKYPYFYLLSLCGDIIIAQFLRFVNMFSEIYPITIEFYLCDKLLFAREHAQAKGQRTMVCTNIMPRNPLVG